VDSDSFQLGTARFHRSFSLRRIGAWYVLARDIAVEVVEAEAVIERDALDRPLILNIQARSGFRRSVVSTVSRTGVSIGTAATVQSTPC